MYTPSEQRDREIERSGSRPMPDHWSAKVVGASFVPAYPDNLHQLDAMQAEAERSGEPLTVAFRRNPDNPYDGYAIEVHVPALGEEMGMIGHLTRPVAARVAPEMDSGVRWSAAIASVLIDPDFPDRPGISISCARQADSEEESS